MSDIVQKMDNSGNETGLVHQRLSHTFCGS